MYSSGSIQLFIGPMFSEKTTYLMRAAGKYFIAGKRCVCVKYTGDNRYEAKHNGVVAHDGVEYHRIPVVATQQLANIDLENYDVIVVDEVQFFPDSVEVLHTAANNGKVILAAGCDATAEGTPFGRIGELLVLAERVKKLRSVCACGRDASFSSRLVPLDGPFQITIAGADQFRPECRTCKFGKK